MKKGAEVGRRVRHATDVCVCAPVWGEGGGVRVRNVGERRRRVTEKKCITGRLSEAAECSLGRR